jgi:hypothetical protein
VCGAEGAKPVKPSLGRGMAAALVLAAISLAPRPAVPQSAARADAAASQPSTAPPEVGDEVIVRGRRLSEVDSELRRFVRQFIGQVTAVPMGRGFARWPGAVCVGVHNLQRDAAQYLVDRISREAAEVGLRPGEPGCSPQVMIIFTTDAKQLATNLVDKQLHLFRPSNEGGTNLGRADLEKFVQSDKAVRWWAVSMPVDARSGQRAVRLPIDDAAPVVSVAGPSRIHSGIRDVLTTVVIIVDGTKLTGTTWEQLADYLAVVSLAQINPDADPSAFDSILNLFSNPRAYSGLTDWDRAYLRGLYEFDQERMPTIQASGLVDEIARQQRDAGE